MRKSGQGRHTTTASTLYHLPSIHADIIDSPGVPTPTSFTPLLQSINPSDHCE
jgi:putative ribosome biogenesis GTPase RsgA